MYKDLGEVREHYAAIRDLIAQNPGGGEALEAVNTRLLSLGRDRDIPHSAHRAGAP